MGWLFDLDEEIDSDRDPLPLLQALGGAIVDVGEGWLALHGNQSFKNLELAGLPYADYLRTDHWLATRERALQRSGRQCQECETKDRPLHVHHMTYRRLGNESESDLVVLCADCHASVHEFYPHLGVTR